MTDIVDRLREYGPHSKTSAFRINDEAADEIERLREKCDKFKWQVIDTCKRAEKAEMALQDALALTDND